MIDEANLEKFIKGFYGYGNPQRNPNRQSKRHYWFIGLEEGGVSQIDDFKHRLDVWLKRGQRELEDLAEYHIAIGSEHHFTGRATLQNTWKSLARIILASEEQVSPDTEIVRAYQRDQFGRYGGDSCLMELMPLPSVHSSAWIYDQTGVATLQSRKTYMAAYEQMRSNRLRQMLTNDPPNTIIFYGLGEFLSKWESIGQVKFREHSFLDETRNKNFKYYTASQDDTRFVAITHPNTFGVPNTYFDHIGLMVGQ